MGGKSKKATIGYKYYLGMHMVLSHGPLDHVAQIEVDKRIAWVGENDGSEPLVFDDEAATLFGGDKREGGIGGTVDVAMGDPTQTQNAYLLTQLGEDLPAFRGVASLVLNQCYVGNNPYLKNWAITAQRVYVRQAGASQWYSGKAGINPTGDPVLDCELDCTSFITELQGTGDPAILTLWTDSAPADWEWPFATENSERATKFTYYNDWVASPVALYDWTNTTPGTGPGIRMSDLSAWANLDEPLGFCNAALATNFQDSGLPISVRIPFNYKTNEDCQFNVVVGAYNGGTTFDSLLYWHTGRKFFVTRSGIGSDFKDVPAFVYIESNGAGGHQVRLRTGEDGEGGSANSSTIDIGDATGKFVLISGTIVTGLSQDGDYVYASTTITAKVTRSDGQTFDGSVIGSVGDFGVQAVTAFGFGGLVDFYETPHFFRSVNSEFITGVLASFDVRADQDMDVLSRAFIDNFESSGGGCGCADMNPAHIIRECLTDPYWGMGYLDADIDDTSFTAAADTLFDEEMGISLLWDRQIPLEDFVSEILRHIDGVLYVNRTTGQFTLKLIRDDYVVGSLITLDETNVSRVENDRRPTIGELTNSVTVNFYDARTGETGSVTDSDQALIQVQGTEINTTVQYPGFTRYNVAARAAQRDLKALAVPLLNCDIVANREAAELNVGDAFILNWPDLEENNVVMRVQALGLGDGRDNSIKISATEDVFSIAAQSDPPVATPEDLWSDPVTVTPLDASPRIAVEMPYYQLVLSVGAPDANDALTDDPDAGLLLVAAGRQANEINASLWTDSGAGYSDSETLDFGPKASLNGAIGQGDTLLTIDGVDDLDLIDVGTIAQIGTELVRVDAITSTSLTVGRGVLDTVPVAHADNAEVLFWGDFYATDEVQYTASDIVNVKLTPVAGANELALDSATTETVTMASRAIRPYAPGNVLLNSATFPDAILGALSVSWAHRDRLQQTSGTLYDFDDASIGPEAGTTYTLRIYDETDALIKTETGLTGTSYNYSLVDEAADSGLSANGTLRIELESVRDGYASFQTHNITADRAGYGYQYGNYYGGV